METHMSKFAMPRLSAYLVCRDAAKAIDFYVAALGAQVLARLDGPDGKLFHATLGVNDGAVVMVAEERPQWGALSPASFNGTAEVRKAVADSRCLGAMGDDALYSALARQPEWADYEVKLPGQDPAPWGIALRKGQPALLAAVSSIVEGWHAQGVIIGLEQRYGLAPNAWVAQQHARASHE